jgi:hypothetical protein
VRRRIGCFTLVAAVWAGFGVWICGWPSGTRTAPPSRGAATFAHVVLIVAVSVVNMRLTKAKLRWHTERTVRDATNAHTHANGARRTDTVVERERTCRVAHDVSGVAAWRGVRTRYRRRSSWSSDGQACDADPVGVPLTRASRGRLPTGRRPLYEYRIEPAFAQARFSGAGSGVTLSLWCRLPPITTALALQYAACQRQHH